MARRLAVAVSTAALGALVLGACSSADPADPANGATATETAAEEGEAVFGGVYTHALEADPSCLYGPRTPFHVALNIIRQAADSLVDINPETGEFVPWLAESWEVNEDATAFTFVLRDGVTFSDGEPFTAEAVVANFEHIAELGPEAVGAAPIFAGFESAEVNDDDSVTVTFASSNVAFLSGLAGAWFGFLSPADLEKSIDELCAGDYSSTGPFVIEDYTVNESATLTQREDYDWPSAVYAHQGPAYVDELVFTFVAESGVRAGSLQSDQVHSISLVQPQDEAIVTGAGDSLLTAIVPGLTQTWIINQQSELLQDAAVREAISLALNREEIATTLYGSGHSAATSLLGSPTLFYSDQSDLVTYDPDAAVAALEAAGWDVGDDGIRAKDGQRLTLNVINSFPEQGELLQQQLAQVGIEYQIRTFAPGESATALAEGDYDVHLWNMTRADPDVLRAVFHSDGGPQGRALANPSDVDAILDAQAGLADAAQRQPVVDEAVRYLLENHWGIPQVDRAWNYGYDSAVNGFAVDAEAKLVFYDVWIDE